MNIKSLWAKEAAAVKSGSMMDCVKTGKSYQECYINVCPTEYSYAWS